MAKSNFKMGNTFTILFKFHIFNFNLTNQKFLYIKKKEELEQLLRKKILLIIT